MRLSWLLLAAALSPLLQAPAFGQTRDPAAAEAFFKDALALMDQGDWSRACPKFQKSHDFDPSVSALVNLARCSEHDGKLASALARLSEASRLNLNSAEGARKQQLDAAIKKLSVEYEARVPRVTLSLGAAPPAGITLKRDGQPLPLSALGEALPVDVGEHVYSASAPGFRTAEKRATVAEKQQLEVTLSLVSDDLPPSSVAPAKRPADAPPLTGPDTGSGPGPLRVVGFTLLGVGGAAVVTGAVLGGLSAAKAGEIPDACDTASHQCTNDEATAIANDAGSSGSTFLTTSLVVGSVGVAVAVVGVVLVAVADPAPSDTKSAHVTLGWSPWFSHEGGGVIAGGTW